MSTLLDHVQVQAGVAAGSATPPLPTPLPDPDTAAFEALRASEYARLDAADQIYLDYTGGGVYADSQLREHHAMLRSGVLGNPHSDSPASHASTELVDRARAAVLDFVHADPADYVVIFTANASAALKLVGKSFPFTPDSRLLLTYDNHNSANGIREFARAKGVEPTYLPLSLPELRQDPDAVLAALDRAPLGPRHLLVYPAQSNYSGVRHPLTWVRAAQERGWDVLLDASAFVPASALDLSRWTPDFVTVSWYKVFGYPTGLGSLIVRRDALSRLRRPWFAGGTIGVASVVEPRHTLGPDHIGFEDGTIDYLGIPGIEIGLRWISGVGIDSIHRHVQALTEQLLGRLAALRHGNGAPLVRLYGPTDTTDRGGTIAFNVLDRDGGLVEFWDVEAQAAQQRISVRTGCFCNPGASETARGITADDMRRILALDHTPGYLELRTMLPDKALGAVRVSLGIATVQRDLDRFVGFLGGLARAS